MFGALRATTLAALCAGGLVFATTACQSSGSHDHDHGQAGTAAEKSCGDKGCGEKGCGAEDGAEKGCGDHDGGEKSCGAEDGGDKGCGG